jgi:hypothetical protein
MHEPTTFPAKLVRQSILQERRLVRAIRTHAFACTAHPAPHGRASALVAAASGAVVTSATTNAAAALSSI